MNKRGACPAEGHDLSFVRFWLDPKRTKKVKTYNKKRTCYLFS
jgi:hypothetical protein